MAEYKIDREDGGVTLKFDYDSYYLVPSIEDDERTMFQTVRALLEVKSANKIIFWQKRDYEYDFGQTQLLLDLARVYENLINYKETFSIVKNLSSNTPFNRDIIQRYTKLQELIRNKICGDPYGAYILIKRILRHSHISVEKIYNENQLEIENKLISVLEFILSELESLKIVQLAHKYAEHYTVGSREIYSNIFSPLIKPDFMYTKLMSSFPKDAEVVDSFIIGEETEVTIFKLPFQTEYLYHILPLEFKLDEDKYELLDAARNILAEHKPEKSDFVNPERMREVFYNIGFDLINELAEQRNLIITKLEKENLTKILIRYTVGFGLIEVLLSDEEMQDISVNSPQGETPIFIVHGKYNECVTNILPTKNETESWATKLRLMSGRSLDEAEPILDTELELPNASVRVSAITAPLDPTGLAFSFRRHRDKPWTLPLFIKYKMINSLGAGLLSFLIDGNRSFLICGTRSSGKSSFLSSILVEIMRRYRIITIEDTLELPVTSLRNLGYNIQQLKVASALGGKSNEVNPSDGIRSTLRLGDSALIVGEVRSDEAVALYEAMRVGAAANVVAGTIHGDSPYGIFDRVVNDIGVPRTSFKATDIIVIANPVRSADGLQKHRRIIQITEVRKDWETDPMREHGFVDLMKYNPVTDELEATDALLNGDSDILKTIASNVKEFSGSWDAIWENILLRAKIKEEFSQLGDIDEELLEAKFVISANDAFHTICEKYKDANNRLISDKIFDHWKDWLTREVRKFKHEKELTLRKGI